MMQYSRYDSPISPYSFLGVVYKRRKMIVGLFLMIVATIVGLSFILPPTYRAVSKVMVSYQGDSEKSYLLNGPMNTLRPTYDMINSEVVILKMRSVLEPVVKALDMDQLEDGRVIADPVEQARMMDKAIEKLSKSLKVEREKDTNVLIATIDHRNPRFAANAVDRIVSEYIKQRPSLDKDVRAYEFFDQQVELIKAQIDAIESQSVDFIQQNNAMQPDKQAEIIYSRLSEYDKELTRVRSERIAKDARLKVMQEQIENGQDLTVPNTDAYQNLSWLSFINELKKTLLELELKKSTMETKYTEKHPQMATVIRDIASTKTKIREQIDELIKSEESDIKALRARESALSGTVMQDLRNVSDMALKQHKLGKIVLGLEDLKMVYSMLVRQREEAKITASKKEHLVQVRLIEPAVVPYHPAKPNRPLFAALAFILGFVVSFGFAFFIEYFDHSVNSVEDAQYCLGLPILASISDFAPNCKKPVPKNGSVLVEEQHDMGFFQSPSKN